MRGERPRVPLWQDRAMSRALLLTAAIFVLACAPAAARTVTLTEARDGTTVTLRAGDRVVIRLAANVTTGYHWVIRQRPPRAVARLTSSQYVAFPNPDRAAGSGGTQVYRLRAAGSGTGRFRVAYVPPGRDGQTAETFAVRLRVR